MESTINFGLEQGILVECVHSLDIIHSAMLGEIPVVVMNVIKPIQCAECSHRFSGIWSTSIRNMLNRVKILQN